MAILHIHAILHLCMHVHSITYIHMYIATGSYKQIDIYAHTDIAMVILSTDYFCEWLHSHDRKEIHTCTYVHYACDCLCKSYSCSTILCIVLR